MPRTAIKQEQTRLKALGLYTGPVDGRVGPMLRDARKTYRAQQATRAQADAAKAKAAQEAAKAQAEKARAETEAVRARTEVVRLERAAEENKRQDTERQRAFQRKQKALKTKAQQDERDALRKTGISVAALATGLGVGLAYAAKIAKQREKAVKAGAPHLKKLAANADRLLSKYGQPKTNASLLVKQLSGVVAAADKTKLTARAPLGIGPALVLLAEGAISRFLIAPTVKNETAKEAFNAVGTASAIAATTILGKGAVNTAAPTVPVNASQLASIEAARNVVDADKALAKAPVVKAPVVKAPVKKPPAARKPSVPNPVAAQLGNKGNIIVKTRATLKASDKALNAISKLGKFVAPVAIASFVLDQAMNEPAEAAEVRARQKAEPRPKTVLARVRKHVRDSVERDSATPYHKGAGWQMANFIGLGIPDAARSVVRYVMSPTAGTPHMFGVKLGGFKAARPTRAQAARYGRVAGGRAFLNAGARRKAATASLSAKPRRAAVRTTGSMGGTTQSYTTKDGRSVQGTKGQIAAWDKRRK